MAVKRSLSQDFLDLPEFEELSNLTKLLYVYINASADDYGFTKRIRASMSYINAKEENLNELVDKGFLYRFESGVSLLLHWRMNNTIRKDRCKTSYEKELKMLVINEVSGIYGVKENPESTFKRYSRRINYVYLIRNGKYTKIGFSCDVLNRLSTIKNAAPLAYIYALKASLNPRRDEQHYQKIFESKRFKREWFSLNDEDFDFLLKDGFKLFSGKFSAKCSTV